VDPETVSANRRALHSAEAVTDTILRRMPDYVHTSVRNSPTPTSIFQRVRRRYIEPVHRALNPTPDEAMWGIPAQNPRARFSLSAVR